MGQADHTPGSAMPRRALVHLDALKQRKIPSMQWLTGKSLYSHRLGHASPGVCLACLRWTLSSKNAFLEPWPYEQN